VSTVNTYFTHLIKDLHVDAVHTVRYIAARETKTSHNINGSTHYNRHILLLCNIAVLFYRIYLSIHFLRHIVLAYFFQYLIILFIFAPGILVHNSILLMSLIKYSNSLHYLILL